MRNALHLVMEVSQLIYSPKRFSLFLTLQSQMTPGSKTLKPLYPTRRTVCTAAISAVLGNYAVLCAALEEVNTHTHDDYGRKAGGYLVLMHNFSTFLGLKLSHLIFSGTELSLTLQGKDTIQLSKVLWEQSLPSSTFLGCSQMHHLIHFILRLRIKKSSLHPVLPRYTQPPKKPGAAGHAFSSLESYFRKEYFEVLNIPKRRFQQKRGLPVATMIEILLVTAANSTSVDLEIPEELHLYENDVDLS